MTQKSTWEERRLANVRGVGQRGLSALILWVMLFGGSALAADSLSGLVRLVVSGREYVRLKDWARANQFDFQWPSPQAEIRLTSRWSSLIFNYDSQRVLVNGVAVYLVFPIAARASSPLISVLDMQTAIGPILFPPRNRGKLPVVHVCLDPGHGGKDPGNQVGSRHEKTYTLTLARALRTKLVRAGMKVTQTRHRDVFIPPADRPAIARSNGADLFISLHFNSTVSGRAEVKGAEVYCFTPVGASSTNARGEGTEFRSSKGNLNNEKNALLAYQIQASLTRSLPVEDRGVRRARFIMLREADVPAVLVEAGYLSHPAESQRIANPAYLDKLAQAIVDGILAYRRLVER